MKRLAPANQRPLGRERLLDLDDHLGLGEHLLGRIDQLRPLLLVKLVGQARAEPRPALDQHPMLGPRQFLDADGQNGDAIFIALDFFGNADDHALSPFKR